jgi:hypothetical protein
MDDTNLPVVFDIIKIFSKFGGDFSWPAHKSGNQTPFSLLLEKLATLKDKDTCIKIIKFLIEKYPSIDKFQREKCTNLIQTHFQELIDEYVMTQNREEAKNMNVDSKSELEMLLKMNEAEFLVKFDTQMNANRMELEQYISEKDLIFLSIEHDRFESFVAIHGLISENVMSVKWLKVY